CGPMGDGRSVQELLWLSAYGRAASVGCLAELFPVVDKLYLSGGRKRVAARVAPRCDTHGTNTPTHRGSHGERRLFHRTPTGLELRGSRTAGGRAGRLRRASARDPGGDAYWPVAIAA